MAQLFGFQITRASKDKGELPSFVLPEPESGATTQAGFYSEFLDLDATAKNEYELIRRYRSTSEHPECDFAIEDIVNEGVCLESGRDSVSVITDDLPYSNKIRTRIRQEFDHVLRLLDFNNKAHDIFRRWYIDGRIHFHKIIDESDPKKGIQELRYIDALKIKRIKTIDKQVSKKGSPNIKVVEDYYQYSEKGMHQAQGSGGFRITKDSIAFAPSGLHDPNRNMVISYLHKANQ